MKTWNALIRSLKKILGWPPLPTDEQTTENLITMRERRDCHIPASAVACGNALGRRVSYEEASLALWHWNLPFFLESPIMSNPVSLSDGIKRLGCKVRHITISSLLNGDAQGGRVICLMHSPQNDIMGTIQSHWVVYMGTNNQGQYLFHWGQNQDLKSLNRKDVIDMLTSGFPNCLMEVYL